MSCLAHARFGRDQLIGSTFSFQHRPLAAALAFLSAQGMREVELWGVAPHLDLFDTDDARLAAVARLLADFGLKLHCFTPEQVIYPVNIASQDRHYREASVARFCHAVDITAELGGKYLLMTSGRGFETAPAEEAWEHAAAGFSRVAAYARKMGVRCLMEPLQRSESNILHNAADLQRMLTEVNADNMDVILDVVGMAAAGDTIEVYAQAFGTRLAHVHIVDGTPAGHLVWGDGALPLDDVMAGLIRAGYAGKLSFEPFGTGNYALDPEAAWRRNSAGLSPWLEPEGSR